MIYAITAGLLFCSGQTNTFDVYLYVDRQTQSISGTLFDSEGTHGSSKLDFSVTQDTDGCLLAPDFKLCLDESKNEASLELTVRNQEATHLEKALLSCKP